MPRLESPQAHPPQVELVGNELPVSALSVISTREATTDLQVTPRQTTDKLHMCTKAPLHLATGAV